MRRKIIKCTQVEIRTSRLSQILNDCNNGSKNDTVYIENYNMDKLNIVLERLQKYKPEKIILFGSYGTPEADEYSDLDLIIIKKTSLT